MGDRFCPNCGTEVDDDARFCPTCGQTLDDVAERRLTATDDQPTAQIPPAPDWPPAEPAPDWPPAEPPSPPAQPPSPPAQTPLSPGPPPSPPPRPPEREPMPGAQMGRDEPPRASPPPADMAQPPPGTEAPDEMGLPFTVPATLSGWLIGAGSGLGAIALLPRVTNVLNVVLVVALLGITATVFLADRLPRFAHLRLATLVVVMIALGVALDRSAFTVRGIDTVFLITMLVAAGGVLLVELDRDRPMPPADGPG